MANAHYTITGISPLLLHSGQAIDPLNQYAKEMKRVSKKRQKTDEDQSVISKVEWFMGLYHNGAPDTVLDGEITVDPDARIMLPALSIEAMTTAGAKKLKLGNSAKSGIIIEEDAELIYTGPKNIEKLYAQGMHIHRVAARVGTARVMRTRPIFREWSAKIAITHDESVIDEPEIFQILNAAGQLVGIGDWRPRFGRFEVARA
jgi:hypothetical protein